LHLVVTNRSLVVPLCILLVLLVVTVPAFKWCAIPLIFLIYPDHCFNRELTTTGFIPYSIDYTSYPPPSPLGCEFTHRFRPLYDMYFNTAKTAALLVIERIKQSTLASLICSEWKTLFSILKSALSRKHINHVLLYWLPRQLPSLQVYRI